MDSARRLGTPRSSAAPRSGIRLLLVDNEADWLTAMQTLLGRRKIATVTATSALEALQVLAAQPIDVVVLDLKMPGMDGIEALRKIKQRYPAVEVIILTGHASVASSIEGMRLGAFDYLTKPCHVQELMDKVKRAYARQNGNRPAASGLGPRRPGRDPAGAAAAGPGASEEE